MRNGLLALCAFAVVLAFGAALALNLPGLVAVVLMAIPIFLALLVWVQPTWQAAAQRRREQVFVYVPPEQREYPGQAYRPYEPVPGEAQDQEVWPW